MGHSSSKQDRVIEIAPGFWNIRGSYKTLGILEIGTHMSIIKLTNGNFVFIDTIPVDEDLKAEIDKLTNGATVEGVVATHPFHTLAFEGFYSVYPDIPYYGTPRHHRVIPQIPWAGVTSDPAVMTKWNPDIEMRIPAGAEWDAPVPESTNHFNSCWVYSPIARTIHVDDTVMNIRDPPLIVKLFIPKDQLIFHPSMKGPGLYPTKEAPWEFKSWVEAILADWDFDNVCCAHVNNKIGGAHASLQACLDHAESTFDSLSKANATREEILAKAPLSEGGLSRADSKKELDCSKYNVSGNECG